MKIAHAVILCLALVGCSSRSDDRQAHDQPVPRVTQTVTASPTATESPTPEVTRYRLTTKMSGHPDLTFVVALNGNTVGTLNGETDSDLTPSVLPGNNAVVLSWTTARPLQPSEKASLTIQRKIAGQEDWTTVYSREVDSRTRLKEARGTFSNEAIGENSGSEGAANGGGGYTGAQPAANGASTQGAMPSIRQPGMSTSNATTGASNSTTTNNPGGADMGNTSMQNSTSGTNSTTGTSGMNRPSGSNNTVLNNTAPSARPNLSTGRPNQGASPGPLSPPQP